MASVTPATESEALTRHLQRHVARQQIATPLSLLILLTAGVLGAVVAKPSLKEIAESHLTVMNPVSNTIGFYWLALAILLVGHCVLLAVPGSSIKLLVSGVGLRLSAINILMAAWVLCFVFKWFLASEIILLVVFVLALSCYATLFYYPATKHRPIEFLFAHVPIRMLVVILLQVDIWQNGLLALGYERPSDAGGKPHWEREHSFHNWIMFGIILGVAVIQSIVVFAQKDVVWCAASTYLAVALALQPEGKSPQIFIAIVLSAVAVCCALVSSIGWSLIKSDREGAIRLVDGEEQQEEEA